MKVLSLFDGISCGRVALDRAKIEVEEYHAYEIDDRAKKVSKFNYPESIYFSDVRECNGRKYKHFDMLIGGSPCQDLSIAMKDREGLAGQKSSLFFEYLRVFKRMKPKFFYLKM